MTFEFVPRSEWGSSSETENYIAGRRQRNPASKTEVHIHHTAASDRDDTPNLWSFDDAAAYMRRLQHVRPDLGPLPYSENVALSEDGRTVWFFEGRGLTVTGAHTGGHNIPGIGWGFLGNFNTPDGLQDLDLNGIPALVARLSQLRSGDFIHLGDTKSPNGSDVWGHRDSKSTSCPGDHLYQRLSQVRFTDPPTNGEETVLKLGDAGDAVLWFQQLLKKTGKDLDANGSFDEPTQTAVHNFQIDMNLPSTGQIDGVTAAILASYSTRWDNRYAPRTHPHQATTTVQ